MPLSLAIAEEHIRSHSERLQKFPLIRHWPKYLVHTAQADTVAKILRSGYLCPRSQLGEIPFDVANPGAIAANPAALHYARLYFRPKTAFHLRTEGIKFRSDPYRQAHHMSIPVMLAFDALHVLALEQTGFSKGKLAKAYATPAFSEHFFRKIPFEKVYHDGPTQDTDIQDARMAEVIYAGCLPIRPHLRFIVCRTRYDRLTLLHLLDQDAELWRDKIVTEQNPGSAFIHKALYIKQMTFEEDCLALVLKRSTWNLDGDVFKVSVSQYLDGQLLIHKSADWPVRHLRGESRRHVPDPRSIWKIEVEGVTAFWGRLPSGRSDVF
jgi:hypothetical protein